MINFQIPAPEEVVLVANPENIPWYINKILKESTAVINLSWHIHSSVPNEKVPKIKGFLNGLKLSGCQSKINLRLIFKSKLLIIYIICSVSLCSGITKFSVYGLNGCNI